jgi:type II secretory pathway component PulF
MPSFRYQSLTSTGLARSGVIAAADRAAAVRQLQGRGETAVSLDVADADERPTPAMTTNGALVAEKSAAGERISDVLLGAMRVGRKARPSLSQADTATLIRELATAIEAGLPLMQSLRTVRRQAKGAGMAAILDHLITRIEAGTTLHQAAKEYGPPFDPLIVGMLRAADASGKMSEVMHQLADLLDRSVELRREVIGATVYPVIVFLLVLASCVVLVTVLVPMLIEPIAAQGHAMPLPTRILIDTAGFLTSYWPLCLLAIAVTIVLWRIWSVRPANRLRIDRFKLKVPVLGRLLRDVAVARFTRTLGTLASAGIPILDALRITRDTLGNLALMDAIDQVTEKVTGGAALADPLERSGLFPPLLVQIVNLGERSGRLESMLLHAAGAFDRQVNTAIKLFTKVLPPVLLIVMASLAGFVLAAILLPLLELQSLVEG